MIQQDKDRIQKIKERLRDLARLPLMLLVMFISAMLCWLGAWAAWRSASWIFEHYLQEPW